MIERIFFFFFVRSKFPDTCWKFPDPPQKCVPIWKFKNTHSKFPGTPRKLWAIWKFLWYRIRNSTIFMYNPNFLTHAGYFQTCWANKKYWYHLIDKWYYLYVEWKIARQKPEISQHRPKTFEQSKKVLCYTVKNIISFMCKKKSWIHALNFRVKYSGLQSLPSGKKSIYLSLIWTRLFDPYIWTRLFGPIYLDLSINICLFGTVYFDQSILTGLFWPV